MIFTSIDFIIFLSIVFSISLVIPYKIKWMFLLAASYFFYGNWNIDYLVLLIIPTLITYLIAIKMNSIKLTVSRKRLFIIGLILTLAGLIIFKYADFIITTFSVLMSLFVDKISLKPVHLIHPIGISFFTFKLVSYLIDVYRADIKPEKHLGYFALYISFFPQIFMGPIDRARHFIPELKKRVPFDIDRVISGVQLIAWGVFKKMVIADRISIFVNEVFQNPQQQGINLIFGAYFYAFQIYCDFSGYTDMAIGISRILGFKSIRNFNFPYFSTSISQFWNRWHISLSTWLRDYLFLPIAYSTMRRLNSSQPKRIKAEAWGYTAGMFVTMFLGGLWHGASWTFVLWGTIHGLYLIASYSTKKARKKIMKTFRLNKFSRLHRFFSILITFNLVSFAWIIFRSESFHKALIYLKNIQFSIPDIGIAHLIFNLCLIIFFVGLEILYKNRDKFNFIKKMPRLSKIAAFALFICFIIIFSVDVSNEFIYFQF